MTLDIAPDPIDIEAGDSIMCNAKTHQSAFNRRLAISEENFSETIEKIKRRLYL
jgi:hypothetical protein